MIDTRTFLDRVGDHIVWHTNEGHIFEVTNVFSLKRRGMRLFKCSCTWSGWLSKDDLITLGWTDGEGATAPPN